jgi:uncharacterized tellurite resistance protein B-like protein
MKNRTDYAVGMLCLIYILVQSDGQISEEELDYLDYVREIEGISDALYAIFESSISGKTNREVYQFGIDTINRCSTDERQLAFVRIYQMAHADGIVHVREVRFLLYAVKLTDVDLSRVLDAAKAIQMS